MIPTPDPDYFESIYERYNRREYVHPDPLEMVYRYASKGDQEIAGLIASSLAYGRVNQILLKSGWVLDLMGPSPELFLKESTRRSLSSCFRGFRYRWTTDRELVDLVWAIKCVREEWGSLNAAFKDGMHDDDHDVLPALSAWVELLISRMKVKKSSLLSSPVDGSACKRMHMFLRWMIRKDDVDPGTWNGIESSRLLVPLDAHMHRIARLLGFTRRRQADQRTVIEITEFFRNLNPGDPVRYDFSLTRFGIHPGMNAGQLLVHGKTGDS